MKVSNEILFITALLEKVNQTYYEMYEKDRLNINYQEFYKNQYKPIFDYFITPEVRDTIMNDPITHAMYRHISNLLPEKVPKEQPALNPDEEVFAWCPVHGMNCQGNCNVPKEARKRSEIWGIPPAIEAMKNELARFILKDQDKQN